MVGVTQISLCVLEFLGSLELEFGHLVHAPHHAAFDEDEYIHTQCHGDTAFHSLIVLTPAIQRTWSVGCKQPEVVYALFIRMTLIFTFPWQIVVLPAANVQWYQQPRPSEGRVSFWS